MKNMGNVKSMLNAFEKAACKYAEASKIGNARVGNKNYKKMVEIVFYLKERNSLNELLPYLNHDAVGVRMATATFLLSEYEKEGIDVLETISKSADFFSFTAELILSEWRKGNLKL